MKLVHNWKSIALKSHAMWSQYLGIATILAPEFLYWKYGYIVADPYVTTYVGLGLIVYGMLGRLKDQGIGDA